VLNRLVDPVNICVLLIFDRIRQANRLIWQRIGNGQSRLAHKPGTTATESVPISASSAELAGRTSGASAGIVADMSIMSDIAWRRCWRDRWERLHCRRCWRDSWGRVAAGNSN